ncbi:MAG: glycerophosphodiester phosphodiesterase [Thermotogaceae bacterium]|nr:glycerophosphodiester phosphodiesterase [Thermotogaceae bacterium]
MRIYGHRGYDAKYPENTILSFKKAFEFGADGIETDVRTTKDGRLIIFHDDDLKRIFGIEKTFDEVTFDELRELEIDGEKVPTLQEVLDIVPESGYGIVEIKDRKAASEAISEVLRREMENRVVFSSFDHELIKDLIKQFPELNFAFLLGEKQRELDAQKLLEEFILHKPHSVHIPKDAFDIFGEEQVRNFLNFLKDEGIDIFLWNTNDVEFVRKHLDLIDAVIIDEVERFVEVFKSK